MDYIFINLFVLLHFVFIIFMASCSNGNGYSTNHYIVPNSLRLSRDGEMLRPHYLQSVMHGDNYKYMNFVLIGDMDNRLKKQYDEKISPALPGTLIYTFYPNNNTFCYSILMISYPIEFKSEMSCKEFSELKVYNGRLLTLCDKTGIIYWLDGTHVIPWVILLNRNQMNEKPFKSEWMTIKDNHLYVGSHGNEIVFPNGTVDPVARYDQLYVKRIDPNGLIVTLNWHENYIDLLLSVVGMNIDPSKDYIIHEAVQWSDYQKRWFFLSRKMHTFNRDYSANILISCNENFSDVTFKMIESDNRSSNEERERNFSTFQFVPETNDTVIIAVKTVEKATLPFESYITVFNIEGTIYMHDMKIEGFKYKYKGLEFINWKSLYWNI